VLLGKNLSPLLMYINLKGLLMPNRTSSYQHACGWYPVALGFHDRNMTKLYDWYKMNSRTKNVGEQLTLIFETIDL